MRILLLLIVILISYIQATAQYQNRYWHFGYNVCLDFAGGEPVYVSGSAMQSYEGSSSQCDASGNLLIYTNGETVYNKLNQVMDNGDNIGGHKSSAQSVVIVPDPGNPNEYYLFTTDAIEHQFENGLCVSKVNMTENGGLGKVYVKKQKLLAEGVTERLMAIKRPGCMGYWVITYQEQGKYIVYAVNEFGIQTPAIYNVGNVVDVPIYKSGFLKTNSDATIIAHAFVSKRVVELVSFNIYNGNINYLDLIDLTYIEQIRGEHFYNNKLYVSVGSTPYRIMRFNIQTDSFGNVIIIKDSLNLPFSPYQISYAKDNKLYIARYLKKFISSINCFDTLNKSCIIDTAVVLQTESLAGLPNEVAIISPQYYPPTASYTTDNFNICPSSCIAFKNTSCDAYQFEWFFEGAVPSYSTDKNPQNICYPNSGTFGVMLVAHHGGYSDTAYMSGLIQVYAPPQFEIVQSGDSLYCNNILPGNTYQWYYNSNIIGNATNPYYTATQNGNYSLQVTNGQGCTEVKTITVTISTSPYVRNICNTIVYYNKDGSLQIRNTGKQAVQYHITDINGRSLYAGMIPYDDFVRTQIVQKGICLLHIICGENKQVMKLVTF